MNRPAPLTAAERRATIDAFAPPVDEPAIPEWLRRLADRPTSHDADNDSQHGPSESANNERR